MNSSAMQLSSREAFLAYLRQNGLKMTESRRRVMESILERNDHFEVDELVNTLKSQGTPVSRATIYRTLELMKSCYLVERLDFGPHGYFYERASPETHHDHMICLQCQAVIEFYSAELEQVQSKLCQQNQFVDYYHSLRIFGMCDSCQKGTRRPSSR